MIEVEIINRPHCGFCTCLCLSHSFTPSISFPPPLTSLSISLRLSEPTVFIYSFLCLLRHLCASLPPPHPVSSHDGQNYVSWNNLSATGWSGDVASNTFFFFLFSHSLRQERGNFCHRLVNSRWVNVYLVMSGSAQCRNVARCATVFYIFRSFHV